MDKNGKWKFSPAYDLMYNNSKKFTFENRMSFNGKLGSNATIADFEQLYLTHSIDNFEGIIKNMQNIKNIYMKDLLKKYFVKENAINEIISSCRELI